MQMAQLLDQMMPAGGRRVLVRRSAGYLVSVLPEPANRFRSVQGLSAAVHEANLGCHAWCLNSARAGDCPSSACFVLQPYHAVALPFSQAVVRLTKHEVLTRGPHHIVLYRKHPLTALTPPQPHVL